MGIIDIVLGALILWGLIRGFMKGLFVEVASLLALVAGIYGAIHFSHFASEFLKSKTTWDENTIHIAALAITFVIIVLAIALAGKALTKLANFAALGILNKLTGAIFGALKMALILSIVLNLFDKINKTIPLINEDRIENSQLYEPVYGLVHIIIPDIWEPTIEIIEDSPLSKDA